MAHQGFHRAVALIKRGWLYIRCQCYNTTTPYVIFVNLERFAGMHQKLLIRNIMKKFLFVFILAVMWGMPPIFAQNTGDMEAVLKIQKELDATVAEAKNGDYKAARASAEEALKVFAAQSESFREDYFAILGTLYYNIACMCSLDNDADAALLALEKSIENGWDEYSHTLADPDLDNIRGSAKYAELMALLRESGDFLYVLRQSGDYLPDTAADMPRFTYQDKDDPDLVKVRDHFRLDSIAGTGDEISRILNLLRWVHNAVRHDGGSMNPESKNAVDLVEICRAEGRGVNCRMMAQILNECYLAMGFKSRYITCMPKVMLNDCHVINAVYSETLGKWIWVDPTFNAYVADENGVLLGIGEVRERLRSGAPLVLNKDANWNNENPQTKEYYLDYYMAKNLYYLQCPLHSVSDSETKGKGEWPTFVNLLPAGYQPEEQYRAQIQTSDEAYYWQLPVAE